MARKRKKRLVRRQRGYQYNSKRKLLSSALSETLTKVLSEDDQRYWSPDRVRIPKDILGRVAEVELARRTFTGARYKRKLEARLKFRAPFITVVCQRRARRRETLFRRAYIGKGRGAINPIRRIRDDSAIRCV